MVTKEKTKVKVTDEEEKEIIVKWSMEKGYKKRPQMRYEVDEFNSYQNFLYKRAMFGLSMYTPEELAIMHWDKKKRIERVNKHAKNVLNLWKQEMTIILTNHLFKERFNRSPFLGDLLERFGDSTDIYFLNTLSFKQLKISKKEIVQKLISEGVLPKEFFELKPVIQEKKVSVDITKTIDHEIRVLS